MAVAAWGVEERRRRPFYRRARSARWSGVGVRVGEAAGERHRSEYWHSVCVRSSRSGVRR